MVRCSWAYPFLPLPSCDFNLRDDLLLQEVGKSIQTDWNCLHVDWLYDSRSSFEYDSSLEQRYDGNLGYYFLYFHSICPFL